MIEHPKLNIIYIILSTYLFFPLTPVINYTLHTLTGKSTLCVLAVG